MTKATQGTSVGFFGVITIQHMHLRAVEADKHRQTCLNTFLRSHAYGIYDMPYTYICTDTRTSTHGIQMTYHAQTSAQTVHITQRHRDTRMCVARHRQAQA